MTRFGAVAIIQNINNYPALGPLETLGILKAISAKISESVILADNMGNTRDMYQAERERAIIIRAIESLQDHLDLTNR